MNIRKTFNGILTSIVLLGLSNSVLAITECSSFSCGNLSFSEEYHFDNSVTSSSFSDRWSFSIGASGSFSGGVTDVPFSINVGPFSIVQDITNLSLNLENTGTGDLYSGISFGDVAFVQEGLVPGNYDLIVSGNIAPGATSGNYSGIMGIVPEAEVWVMLIAGAGMIGWSMRRHKGVRAARLPAAA